jgi:hypothetical protein
VEEVDAADRDRADRVAVVGLVQVDEGGAAGVLPPALLLVLEGHLQRDLDRGRARLRVEDAAQALRGEVDEAIGQLDRPRVREAEHGRVRNLLQLGPHRRVDPCVPVPVHVAPQRRYAVQVTPSLDVDQVGALAPLDDQRLFLDPRPLLRERVPDPIPVQPREV